MELGATHAVASAEEAQQLAVDLTLGEWAPKKAIPEPSDLMTLRAGVVGGTSGTQGRGAGAVWSCWWG